MQRGAAGRGEQLEAEVTPLALLLVRSVLGDSASLFKGALSFLFFVLT
jgi:hypothetical protein